MKQLLALCLLFQFYSCSTKTPVVIAHRGASGYLPEHTLEAASLAHGFNPTYIEPDVVLTRDNVPVVLHDIHLESTTNVEQIYPNKKRKDGHWYAIDLTLKQIKRLSVHERYNNKKRKSYFENRFPQRKSDFEVPTLQEIIDLVEGLNKSRGKKIGLYPEIKKPEFHLKQGKDITKIVYGFLELNKLQEKGIPTIIQCFDPKQLKRLRTEFKSKFPLVQLIAENSWSESSTDYDKMKSPSGIAEISSYADGIGPWIPQLVKIDNKGNMQDTGLAALAKKHGLMIHAYTFRSEQVPKSITKEKLLDYLFSTLKIEGIFADQPDVVLQHFK